MPATIVHAYFAKDVRDILPEGIKYRTDEDRLKMFAQGTDSLMFYNMFSIFPGKKIRDLNKIFHNTKTREYFINLLNYIKRNDLFDDVDVCSYLIGFICHYALDSIVHPYVIYKSGVFDKRYKSTYKYNNVHTFMETFLDNDMVSRREDISPYHFKIGKFCFTRGKFSYDLTRTIDISFESTYNYKNMGRKYYRSLKQMKHALLIFRRDPIGVKKFFYKLVDTFTSKRLFRFEAISYHYPLDDRHNYLNLDHKEWRNPVKYNLVSNESFLDLYLKALKLAKILVCASFDYITDKTDEIDKKLFKASYISGLNSDIEPEYKYFEF